MIKYYKSLRSESRQELEKPQPDLGTRRSSHFGRSRRISQAVQTEMGYLEDALDETKCPPGARRRSEHIFVRFPYKRPTARWTPRRY